MSSEPIDDVQEGQSSMTQECSAEVTKPILNPHILDAIAWRTQLRESEEFPDSIENFNAFLSFSRS